MPSYALNYPMHPHPPGHLRPSGSQPRVDSGAVCRLSICLSDFPNVLALAVVVGEDYCTATGEFWSFCRISLHGFAFCEDGKTLSVLSARGKV